MLTQQGALYMAENMTHWGYRFTGPSEVQEFLDELRETWWWEQNCSNVLRVFADFDCRRKRSTGGYDDPNETGVLTFNTRTPSMHLVLHELAHVLAAARYGSTSHDPWFARILLELTFLVRGSDSYRILAEAFRRDGIDFDAPGVVDSSAIPT